jgi:WD40 repeat protein
MKRVLLAAVAAFSLSLPAGAADVPRNVIAIDYAKSKGLVAAAYQGGQVVVWDFATGSVKKVFGTAAAGTTRNKPLVRFSPDGRRVAFTAEGEAGLTVYDLDAGTSTVVVPSRLLYRGITAFSWSRLQDSMLVAIGRDILLITSAGHIKWQRRLETRAIISDVVWHPSEKFYTVATDDTTVSSWETVAGQVTATAVLDTAAHSAPVKVGWTNEGFSLAAVVDGEKLVLLDPESLKPDKSIPCKCTGFDWSPAGKELAVWAPPNVAVFTASGQRAREIHTPFEGASPVLWADDGHILAAFSDSSVVLRDAHSAKVVKTFAPPGS